jgi:hypothetical protein
MSSVSLIRGSTVQCVFNERFHSNLIWLIHVWPTSVYNYHFYCTGLPRIYTGNAGFGSIDFFPLLPRTAAMVVKVYVVIIISHNSHYVDALLRVCVSVIWDQRIVESFWILWRRPNTYYVSGMWHKLVRSSTFIVEWWKRLTWI